MKLPRDADLTISCIFQEYLKNAWAFLQKNISEKFAVYRIYREIGVGIVFDNSVGNKFYMLYLIKSNALFQFDEISPLHCVSVEMT